MPTGGKWENGKRLHGLLALADLYPEALATRLKKSDTG
jgi:hypothetical protein